MVQILTNQSRTFVFPAALVAAGLAAWFSWPWYAILGAFIGGAFIGAVIDEIGKK